MRSAAVFYHPEGYTTTGPRLMGRNAAGESFLRGLLAHAQTDEFWAQVGDAAHARMFEAAVRAAGRTEPVHVVGRESLEALARPGCVFHPGPGIGEAAWHRAVTAPDADHRAWSLCGITHTTSSARAMDAIVELLTAPVQPWDALICTSSAVRDNVRRLLEAQGRHLRDRLGARRWILPKLPVIPLGVHASDFEHTDAQRAQARRAIGADASTLVVLFTGRLSFHAKAHPLAMYQALERAARGLPSGSRVLLVECGWHANASIAKAFSDAAGAACPSVPVVTLDGRDPQARKTAWACADVFCSLSDNIQETFGIVPIEAMAAGLPVVVSDWDGYKDTVRDGIDGFRVPTMAPGPGYGADLARRHALELDNYDMYCGNACALAAVDVEATAVAFRRLFVDPALRRRMGEAGRDRVRTGFDWSVIIRAYQSLWSELAELRAAAPKVPRPAHPWPARMDPFDAFASYPTRALAPGTRLQLAAADPSVAREQLRTLTGLAMVAYARQVMPTQVESEAVLEALARGSKTATELASGFASMRRPFVFRALVFLLKLGVIVQAR